MDLQTQNTRPKIIRKARQWRYVWDGTLGMNVKKWSLSPLSHHGYIFHLEASCSNCIAPIAWQASEIYSSRVPKSGGHDTRVESPVHSIFIFFICMVWWPFRRSLGDFESKWPQPICEVRFSSRVLHCELGHRCSGNLI